MIIELGADVVLGNPVICPLLNRPFDVPGLLGSVVRELVASYYKGKVYRFNIAEVS